MFKNLFKHSLTTLSLLTGFAIAIFIAFPTGEDIVAALVKSPYLVVGLSIVLLIWAVMLLVLSVIMLFSEKKRNEAFTITTQTELRDELEEAASNDAIKKTFVFNLALVAFIFALSGFHFDYSPKKDVDDKRSATFGYSLWHDEGGAASEKMAALIKDVDPKVKAQLEKKGIQLEVKGTGFNSGSRLIPARVFSPFGALCFILTQLLMYKLFLFLNLRALSSEADDE